MKYQYCEGRNTTDNSNKIKAIKENTFFYLFLVMVTVFVVMFLLSFLLPLSGKSVLCLRFSCFIVALLFIENYCSIMLKADKRFDVIGRAQVIKETSVIGKANLHIPLLGYLFHFIKQPLGYGLLIGLPAFAIVFSELWRICRRLELLRKRNRQGMT